MKIDPKQIAKMITENPDEVNPLDNIKDKFEGEEECSICGSIENELLLNWCEGVWQHFCDNCVMKPETGRNCHTSRPAHERCAACSDFPPPSSNLSASDLTDLIQSRDLKAYGRVIPWHNIRK